MVAGAFEAGDEAGSGRLTRILEAQRGRVFLWSPLALTLGIWTYFGLPVEPGWLATGTLACGAVGLLLLGRHRGAVILVGLVLLGVVLAKTRATLVATPLLTATTGEVAIEGTVVDVSRGGKRRVLVLVPSAIAGLAPEAVPRRLRLSSLARHGEPRPGDHVTTRARLAPLPPPVMPGGFDYGRQLYFEGIGGTGRVTAPLQVSPKPATPGLRLEAFLEETRKAINRRINAVLDGDTAAFAEALIDGERGTIPKDLNRSFQISGLAHVLSISGLHMSLVAGGVFWLVRAVLALFPPLALRHPIRKWAAVAALAAGLFYMLLSGSGVATQRSYIMIAVVFFAVLVDRPAVSLRNLAIAALIILALQPEAATQASFQMSFLAVLGLAAFFEAWARWRRTRNDDLRERRRALSRMAWKVAAIAGASLATTLVAGTMSSIPAAYHFGRVAPYGILGNGLAIPVVSAIVMPMALVAALLMPFGLEAWPLWIMGQGLDLTIAISDWVAGLPGAAVVVRQPTALAASLVSLGAVLVCLLAGWPRLAGMPLVAAGLALGVPQGGPDILVGATGDNVAVRNAVGELVPVNARRDRFAVEKWLLANGESVTLAEAARRPGWTCAGPVCRVAVRDKAVMVASRDAQPPLNCAGIDILIAAFPLRGTCRLVKLRIDRFDLWRDGGHAVFIGSDGVTVRTAREMQGARPWRVIPTPRTTKFRPN